MATQHMFNLMHQITPSEPYRCSDIMVFGSNKTGKSALIRQLLTQNIDVPTKIRFTNIDFTKYKELGVIEEKASNYESVLEQIKNERQLNSNNKSIDHRKIVVFDDNCLTKDNISTTQMIFFKDYGRYYNTMMIINLDTVFNIRQRFRDSTNFVFIFKIDSDYEKDILYRHWGTSFPHYTAFNKILEQYTVDNCCLVINRTTDGEDKICWYRVIV